MGTDLEQEEEEGKRNKSNSKTNNRSHKLYTISQKHWTEGDKKFTTPTMTHKLSISHVLLIKT